MDASEPVKQRRWWHLRLAERPYAGNAWTDGFDLRPIVETDLEALALLMLDAYDGTIDSEGETIVEAREEVAGWLQHDWPDPVCSQASTISFGHDGSTACAVLVSLWEADEALIGYVITAPANKGSGLGRALVEHTLDLLTARRISTVRAAITAGNTPSERLFNSAGFTAGSLITD